MFFGAETREAARSRPGNNFRLIEKRNSAFAYTLLSGAVDRIGVVLWGLGDVMVVIT